MSRSLFFGLCMAIFFPLGMRGQEWSAEQQEVWRNVETYWHMFATEDVEGFLSYLHEDFSGWTHTSALPRDKEDMARYLPRGFETTETILYDVNPVGIKVHGNIAIVHYYYTRSFVDLSGGEHSEAGRWTEVLMRQGDRWVMITDHGGSDARS